jgi:hypothetical protein
VTRLEEDFATLEGSRPEPRGATAVFDAAAGTARRRRRTARLASTGVAVVVVALGAGGVALAGGGGEDPVQTGPGVAGSPDETSTTLGPPTTAAPETTVPPTTVPGGPSTTLPPSSRLAADDLVDVRVLSAGGADQVIFQLAPDTPNAQALLDTANVQPLAEPPLDCWPEGVTAPSYLAVTLGAATSRDPQLVPSAIAAPRTYESARRVVAVGVGCVFDGEITTIIGLESAEVATRVDRLDGPPRLLIELYPA